MTKAKSTRRCVVLLIALLAPGLAYANTGVFEGSGHTIKLVRSRDIQLQSEHVIITPGRGPFLLIDNNTDRVEYRCKFVLHNRSKKPVTIQVGFPLTGESVRRSENKMKPDDVTALVLRHKFIARDKEKTYHVRFVPSDNDKELFSIFLWDMTFQGDEVRELNVAYEIPMAMGLGDTTKNEDVKYAKKWYSKLSWVVSEYFDYVTVTGQSWAGSIENAKFEVRVAGFEQYLNDRFIIEEPSFTAEERSALEKEEAKKNAEKLERSPKDGGTQGDSSKLWDSESNDERLLDWHVRDRVIDRRIFPEGSKEANGVITWEFKNYRPKDPIFVSYTLTLLPKKPEGVPSFVQSVLGDKPSKENLSDLREIFLAWWGIAPKSKSVREFVFNQRWYSPKDGMTVDKLTTEQKAVISAIEQCSTTKQSPSL